MLNLKSIPVAIGSFSLAFGVSAYAQGGPSLQQAQAECQSIAAQQTGYNPNAATTAAQPQKGGGARGAAAGAMAGAAKGASKAKQYENVPDNVAEEYTKNQMQDAAKKGAAAGTAKQRQGAAAQQRAGASAEAYKQAYSSCMTAKGFPGQ
jgi:hypothetical protein